MAAARAKPQVTGPDEFSAPTRSPLAVMQQSRSKPTTTVKPADAARLRLKPTSLHETRGGSRWFNTTRRTRKLMNYAAPRVADRAQGARQRRICCRVVARYPVPVGGFRATPSYMYPKGFGPFWYELSSRSMVKPASSIDAPHVTPFDCQQSVKLDMRESGLVVLSRSTGERGCRHHCPCSRGCVRCRCARSGCAGGGGTR